MANYVCMYVSCGTSCSRIKDRHICLAELIENLMDFVLRLRIAQKLIFI